MKYWMFLALLGTLLLAQDKELKVAYIEFPPFYGDNLPNRGPISEIIDKAFLNTNYKVTYESVPWGRAILMLEKGKVDALYTLWKNKERQKTLLFSKPIPPSNKLVFFKRKDVNIPYESTDDLKKYSIGNVKGYIAPEQLANSGIQFQEIINEETMIKMLIANQVDLVLCDRYVANYVLATKFPFYSDAVEYIKKTITEFDQHLVFSKQNPEGEAVLNSFNQALEDLKDSGATKLILEKYGM